MRELIFTMKTITVILIYISGLVKAEQKINGLREIDLVLNGLNEQSWNQDELPCYKQTVFFLENAKNYTVWAMMIWNSMQRPVGTFYGTLYSLGSYDQCIQNIPNDNVSVIRTQYCLADVKLTSKQFEEKNRKIMSSTESYLGVKTRLKRDLSKMTWGTCLPASCKPYTMAKILRVIYLVNPITPDEPSITVDHCQVAGEVRKFTIGFYIFMALIIGLITAVLLSSCYVPYADINSTECFNLKRNFLTLTKDLSPDDIPILNLTKVFLSPAVVLVHSSYFTMSGPINNIITSDDILSLSLAEVTFVRLFMKNLDLAIEVYLIMSTIFFIKGLMKKRRHPLISLLNRYFRLIGTYAVVTFYAVAVSMHTGDGPMWSKLAGKEHRASSANWHWSLLLLNNYIGSENFSILVSWYIHVDYQLTIMGTIIFMLWQKDKRFAKLFTILIFILSILTPAVVTYWKKLPGLMLFDDIEKILDSRKNEVFLVTYIQSQHRAVTYLLGMATGYILTVYKPTKSRKILSMKMSVSLFVLVCLFCTFIMNAAVSWCGNDEVLAAAVEIAFKRLFFGLKACSSILLIEYGNFTYLEKLAGHKIYSILSRLAYGIYMTHSIFIQHNTYSRRNPYHIKYISEIIYGYGVWTVSLAVSTLMWFLVEAPINNIFNLIINVKQVPESVNGMKSKKI